jgi:hypothetical protein
VAGARKVKATRSHHEVVAKRFKRQQKNWLKRWVCSEIFLLLKKTNKDFAQADLITNLDHVRPLHAATIELMKPTAVIPLMWEVWEYRQGELDLEMCIKKCVVVAGTNEQLLKVNTFAYMGPVAIKFILQAGLELVGCKIGVIGSDPIGTYIAKALKQVGCTAMQFNPLVNSKKQCSLI